jgi:hypothetical protein
MVIGVTIEKQQQIDGMGRYSWNCVYVSYNYTVHYGAQPNVRFEVMILNDMKVTIVLEAIYNACHLA